MEDIRTFRIKDRDGDAVEMYLRSCAECPLCTVGDGRMVCGAGAELSQTRDLSIPGFPPGCPLPATEIPRLGPCPVCGSTDGTMKVLGAGSLLGPCIATSCGHCGYGSNYGAGHSLKDCADDWNRARLKAEGLRQVVHAGRNGGCGTCEYFREKEGCLLEPNMYLPEIRICGMWLERGAPTERDSLGRMPCPLCGSRSLGPVYDRSGLRDESKVVGTRCEDCGLSICDAAKWNRVAEMCRQAKLLEEKEDKEE